MDGAMERDNDSTTSERLQNFLQRRTSSRVTTVEASLLKDVMLLAITTVLQTDIKFGMLKYKLSNMIMNIRGCYHFFCIPEDATGIGALLAG
jgi:hypothetical protein